VSEKELGDLVGRMGQDMGDLMMCIRQKDKPNARATLVTLMAAFGMLAVEVDELDDLS
jgi:hypothetical protein